MDKEKKHFFGANAFFFKNRIKKESYKKSNLYKTLLICFYINISFLLVQVVCGVLYKFPCKERGL